MKITKAQIEEFLRESNAIENEHSEEAFEDALMAWKYATAVEKIDLLTIRNIHGFLMMRLRPDICGAWRRAPVRIGGEVKNSSIITIERELTHVVTKMNWEIKGHLQDVWTKVDISKEDFTKEVHVQFEEIHPFEDGNGRVGRILYNWHRIRVGLPIHVIHAGTEQMEYYKWFK